MRSQKQDRSILRMNLHKVTNENIECYTEIRDIEFQVVLQKA